MLYQAIFLNRNGDAIRIDRVTAETPAKAKEKAKAKLPEGTARWRLVPMDRIS